MRATGKQAKEPEARPRAVSGRSVGTAERSEPHAPDETIRSRQDLPGVHLPVAGGRLRPKAKLSRHLDFRA
jgi:hypothetical protein